MTEHPSLADFDPAARALLAGLDRHGLSLLSIEAERAQDAACRAKWPADPREALAGALAALRPPATLTVEAPLEEIRDALDLACLILGREEDLDAQDCRSLWALLDRARTLLKHHSQGQEEARGRLRKAAGLP